MQKHITEVPVSVVNCNISADIDFEIGLVL